MAAWSAVLFGGERSVWQGLSVSGSALDVGDGGFLRALRLQSPCEERGGTTALLLAARAGDVRAIGACLDAGASMTCVERKAVPSLFIQKGTGALHAAAWHGHEAATRLLLERRAHPRLVMCGKADDASDKSCAPACLRLAFSLLPRKAGL